jgi:putative endonuclease
VYFAYAPAIPRASVRRRKHHAKSLPEKPKGPMYFVYIMTNRSRTLYIGVTNSLLRRVREHKTSIASGFTAKYKLDRLVYFERFEDVRNAIEREKRIKGWLRIKKTALIISINPGWRDLSERWSDRHQYQPQSLAP